MHSGLSHDMCPIQIFHYFLIVRVVEKLKSHINLLKYVPRFCGGSIDNLLPKRGKETRKLKSARHGYVTI